MPNKEGCDYCNGDVRLVDRSHSTSVSIRNGMLIVFNTETYEILLQKDINLCPFCGTEL